MDVSLCKNLRCTQPWFTLQIPRPTRQNTLALIPTRPKPAARRPGLAAECSKAGPIPTAKRASEKEEEEEEEEWIAAARMEEKCGSQGAGLVELLECLEKEAIMGEDQGRDPNDYNRRAKIFDKSSRVFQALKERSATTSSTTPTCGES